MIPPSSVLEAAEVVMDNVIYGCESKVDVQR